MVDEDSEILETLYVREIEWYLQGLNPSLAEVLSLYVSKIKRDFWLLYKKRNREACRVTDSKLFPWKHEVGCQIVHTLWLGPKKEKCFLDCLKKKKESEGHTISRKCVRRERLLGRVRGERGSEMSFFVNGRDNYSNLGKEKQGKSYTTEVVRDSFGQTPKWPISWGWGELDTLHMI